jgi:ferritin-like metal-binding protein YciE
MSIDSLNDLFVEELKDLLSAEKQITKALPKMIKAANSPELQSAFEEHLALTEGHIERLEQVFERLGLAPEEKPCKGMAGLIEEGNELLKEAMAPSVKDAALISAAQRVEHYEMAVYGSLRTYAQLLGDIETAQILQSTLDEEGDADRKLTQLAEFSVNLQAAEADMEEVES